MAASAMARSTTLSSTIAPESHADSAAGCSRGIPDFFCPTVRRLAVGRVDTSGAVVYDRGPRRSRSGGIASAFESHAGHPG